MATTYKTPGVYIEEISIFPPSVAQVETAIPAFIGYTESAVVDGTDYHVEKIVNPIKIGSLPEYEYFFGGAPKPTSVEVVLNGDNSVKSAKVNGVNLLYDSVRMFYINGGGDCYIVSVGKYNTSVSSVKKQDLIDGLAKLEKFDLPTLLVIPESVHLSVAETGEVHSAMLAQSAKLQDRFAVLDIVKGDTEATPTSDPVADFRNNVGMNNLKYGAVYYPWLKTTLPFNVDYNAVVAGSYSKGGIAIADIRTLFNSAMIAAIKNIDDDVALHATLATPTFGLVATRPDLITEAGKVYAFFKAFYSLTLKDTDATNENSAKNILNRYTAPTAEFNGLLKMLYDYNFFSKASNNTTVTLPAAWSDLLVTDTFAADFPTLTFAAPATGANNIYTATKTAETAAPYFAALLGKIAAVVAKYFTELKAVREKRTETLFDIDPIYKAIATAIGKQSVVLPPSGAVVGLYAAVDNERGVWKAPANISISAVKGPAVNITHNDQESLNIDTEAGKSVNAIRAFTGKGTLVWGARTLAGNDNEWRYIPVRRFFNMVEESVKKATSRFVFEPNDANTWVKVRAMIENFLFLQWRAGALAGAKPDEAYFVRVGLGQTMTAQDILNGYMHVEVGMAAVRPAEFIILKFSHKLQQS
jgi:phage tail sheath protein FI